MSAKFVLVSMESFSPAGAKGKKVLTYNDLPDIVRIFLENVSDPLIILDESSRIKTNAPMAEKKKSTRSRLIKLLNKFGERIAMTGTMMSKSSLNLYDQFNFLYNNYFNEDMFSMAERYCIMHDIHVGRGRRVLLSQKDWYDTRNQMLRAYRRGGEAELTKEKNSISRYSNISLENLEWICEHKKYNPFINKSELMRRIAPHTVTIRRSDVFDVSFEYYLHNPIVRTVKLPKEALAIAEEFIELGFTDNFTLGSAPALELMQRMLDICNGFEPISPCLSCGRQKKTLKKLCPYQNECTEGTVQYRPFKENPKLEALFELIEEIGPDDNQIVVWSSRQNMFDAVTERLRKEEIPYCEYSGKQTPKEKKASEESFESGESRVCVANQASGGYGLNCFAACNYTIQVCSNSSVEQDYQSRHRFVRGQATEMKYAYRVFVEKSVESRIYEAISVGTDLVTGSAGRDIFEFG